MNAGAMPAIVAEHIAAKYHLPMQSVLNGAMTQDPYCAYWKVELQGPHGSVICVPVSDQMMLAGGPSAAAKYEPNVQTVEITKSLDAAILSHLSMVKPAATKGLNAYLDEQIKANITALLNTPLPKWLEPDKAYDPPCKPAKKGQQVSLDI